MNSNSDFVKAVQVKYFADSAQRIDLIIVNFNGLSFFIDHSCGLNPEYFHNKG